MKGLPLLLAACSAILGCQSRAPTHDASELDAARDAMRVAVLRGDASAIALQFAPGAVITPPDAEEVVGRDAIRTLFSGLFQQLRITQYDLKPDTILFSGDGSAIERGTYLETVAPSQGQPTLLNGRYVFFWERGSDGVWRAGRLLFNHGPAKKP